MPLELHLRKAGIMEKVDAVDVVDAVDPGFAQGYAGQAQVPLEDGGQAGRLLALTRELREGRGVEGHVFHCAGCGADLSKAERMFLLDKAWLCEVCRDRRVPLAGERLANLREKAKERLAERLELEALRNRCALLEEENERLGLQAREATSDRIAELLAEQKHLQMRFDERDGAARLLEDRVIEEQKKRVRAEDNSRALHEALEAEMERLDDAEDYSTAVRWLKVAAIVAISAVIAIGIMIWVTLDTGPVIEEMTTTVNTMPGSQELPQIDWEVMR